VKSVSEHKRREREKRREQRKERDDIEPATCCP